MSNLSLPDEHDPDTPRKSSRQRRKPKKFGEFIKDPSLLRNRGKQDPGSEEEVFTDDDDEACPQKPTALFSNDDVEGQDMFKFKSRHTKQDLQNVVNSTRLNSPKIPDSPLRTPRKSLLKKQVEPTPKRVKDIMKKRIIKEVDSDSSDGDFSASSSDFVPDGSDNESESSHASAGSEADEEEVKPQAKVLPKKSNRTRAKDSEYIVTPDNYFMMHSSKKIVTSDHTLERLKNFNLNENMEQQDEIQVSDEHKKRISELNQSYEQLFDRWLYVLSENFSIVLYGVGSKRSILHQFQREKLQDFPCVVVNGFFPSLTMKSILESIVVDLLECSQVPSNVSDVVGLVDAQLSESGTQLFLIVHNIDGCMLRNAKAQAMLASLSQIKRVHMLATIDHINAPLLWDHSKLSRFRFSWWDATTFLPYTQETAFENSLLSHRAGALQLASLQSVHRSLTANARGIFNIIIRHQLEHEKQPNYQGLPFRTLYSLCREQFLVSSVAALRAQLTEFLDHRLVRARRTLDAGEALRVPVGSALLRSFADQQDD